ncbi:MAG: hypothetical protein ACLQLG_12675 [Thermoguttaceae bacterium]
MKASLSFRAGAVRAPGIVLLAAVAAFGAPAALAMTPESPAVKKAIKKAVRYLASDENKDERIGAKALVGLVMLKNHEAANHPRITAAVTAIQAAVKGQEPANVKLDAPIYTAGVSVIFLATLDPHTYAGEIDSLLRYLQYVQKPHGGWGYLDRETGDTSMTQYGVLSAWEAKQAGCRFSRQSIEKVTSWLLRTQDPSGAFAYQGKTPAEGIDILIKQDGGIGPTMSVAGVGSVFMSADLLDLVPRATQREENLPPALKEIDAPRPAPAPAAAAAEADGKPKLDPRRIKAAEARGIRYIASSTKGVKHCKMNYADWWTFYYLYAYERYASFRELAEGRTDKEPAWYNDGARFLLKKQDGNGSWSTKDSPSGRTPDTAFAVLFLLRSSKRSIEKAYGYGESTLLAGRGLSKETAAVTVLQGKVVPVPQWKTAAELLPMLANREDPAFDQAIAALDQLPAKEAEVLAMNHAEVLRRLVADRAEPARTAAVKTIGNGNNLDLVPALVYTLGDPDAGVAAEACQSLRRLSRTLGTRPVPTPLTEQGRRDEIQYWKQWYLAIRPEAEFDI